MNHYLTFILSKEPRGEARRKNWAYKVARTGHTDVRASSRPEGQII